jgi:IclR family mhp operon transcriptional activator
MGRDSDIQSVVRALNVLEALNQVSVASVEAIHQMTGLPKPTLIRILGTLANMGYVFHVSRRDGYALTEKVVRLSGGFRHFDAIVDAARPELEAFTREHKWQLSIATPETDALRVRFNTRHLSPFAPDQRFLNRRIGILGSAMGRAYLAFCSEIERKSLLKFLEAKDPKLHRTAEHRRKVREMIDRVQRLGYATIERQPGDHVRSFAVPVMPTDPARGAIAAISMFYFSSAMTEGQATSRFCEPVCQIGRRIAASVEDAHTQPGELQQAC